MGSRYSFTGRLVQGDPHLPQPQRKDLRTGAPKFLKDGQPDKPFYLAVAVPKNPASRMTIPGTATYEETKALLDAAAREAWPQFFGQRPAGLQFPASLPADCTLPKFANKVIDGDGYDEKGQPNSGKDGWAGCWVIKVQSYYAPKVYEWTASGWTETVHTGRKIKCGDYVTISGDTSSNQSTESPGMYLNIDTVAFEQKGPAIVGASNVDPNAALGQREAPNAAAPAPGGAHVPPANAPAAPVGAPAPGVPTSPTASEPYSGYRDAPAVPPPAAAPPPAGPQMTDKATTTYDAYRNAGWTDDQLRAHGLMA